MVSQTKSRKIPTRKILPLCVVSRYTPMMYADRFVADDKYRTDELQTAAPDQPLVAHFCP